MIYNVKVGVSDQGDYTRNLMMVVRAIKSVCELESTIEAKRIVDNKTELELSEFEYRGLTACPGIKIVVVRTILEDYDHDRMRREENERRWEEADAWRQTLTDKEKEYIRILICGDAIG